MIERHVRFQVPAVKEADFIRFVEHVYFPALREQRGFMHGSLLRESEAPGRHVMVLKFAEADHAAAWKSSARHKLLSPELKSLHEGSEVTVFEVVLG